MISTKIKERELTPKQKDDYLNVLLIYMKNEIEKYGASNYKQVTFNFNKINIEDENTKDGEDRKLLVSENKIPKDDFDLVLNFGITHKFIASLYRGYGQMYITDEGMDRALSIERATYKPAVSDTTNITFNGPVTATNLQAGNHNIQNLSNTFYYIIDEIKKSDATDEEKKTVLSKLKEFISTPIVSGITSECAVEIIKFLTGMGI
ncbi:MAG: hypothetical protein IJD57_01550 [Candidatus Gastranaerophilales bacterium]|nr:hypothetical protein [Candidatus Gastranaerophilales bacterium]